MKLKFFLEVFGINNWVRSFVDRIVDKCIPSLAMPLLARTAPEINLRYREVALTEGRWHKVQTTTQQILDEASHALTWLKQQCSQSK